MKPRRGRASLKRVLIVDDDEGLATMVADVLGARGYKISRVHDGIEAMNTILDAKPDLVVLDLTLPRLSGYEVCAMVRKAQTVRRTAIVIMSGQGDVDHRLEAFAAGADDYVTKPFDPDELAARVEAVMLRSRERPLTTPFLGESCAA